MIAPPTVSLAVDHSAPAKGATLHFTATADDPDGGSIDEYRFSVDGAVVQTAAIGTCSLSRRFDTPGSHTVAVRATDDEGQTATATKTVTISAPSGGVSTAPPAGGGSAPDTAAPAVTLAAAKQKLKAVLRKGLALRAACSEACTLKVQLVVDKRTAKKLKLGKKATVVGTLTHALSGTAKLKLKLTGKAKKRLKKVRSVKLSLRAVATDAAGNSGPPTVRAVTVKR